MNGSARADWTGRSPSQPERFSILIVVKTCREIFILVAIRGVARTYIPRGTVRHIVPRGRDPAAGLARRPVAARRRRVQSPPDLHLLNEDTQLLEMDIHLRWADIVTLVIDLLIVLLLILALGAGLRAGLFATLGALSGLVAGAVATPWVLPLVARAIPDSNWRAVGVVGTAILLLAMGASIGAGIGSMFRRGADRLRLRLVERLFGGLLGLLAATLAVSLTGSAVASAGIPQVSSAVASSTALRTLDRLTPEPLGEAAARLHAAVIGDTVLPTLNGLLDEGLFTPVPDADQIGLDDPALAAAAESVARISGFAYACGTLPSGSGFVVAEDRIVTNAHVVAGVETPLVELPGEPARDGQVVYFDPVDDLAVIAVDIDAQPLPIDDSLEPGDGGVVMGYPYGGPFRAVPAGVAATGPALIDDIYGETSSERFVHALRAEVAPGNSGGPLLTESGAVAGVVFARDEVHPDVGYAMTVAELLPVIAVLDDTAAPVPTGRCASDA